MKNRLLWFSGSFMLVLILGYSCLVAWNGRSTPEKIAAGRELFLHEWTENDPLCDEGDGLGPVFNASSCVACHWQGGIGGGGGNESNVTAFSVRPDRRVGREKLTGGVVHADAVSEEFLESTEDVQRIYPIVPAGSRIVGGCTVNVGPLNLVRFNEINTPHLFGAGLIDRISSSAIAFAGTKRMASEVAKGYSGSYSGNGLGRTNTINGLIGKFGWKGQFVSLEDFVAAACANELGLTNPLRPQPIAKKFTGDPDARLDMTRAQFNELVCFVQSLPRPEQILPEDPQARQRAVKGEELFVEVGCTDCHVKTIGGIEGVYSDFHLYDVERRSKSASYFQQEIGDDFEISDADMELDLWKTPPLWGVADTAPYFHDGESETLVDAIARHGRQAKHSMKLYNKLPTAGRKMIVEFLETLRTPQLAQPVPTE